MIFTKDWQKELTISYFENAKSLTNELHYLIKNGAKGYIEPTVLQLLKLMLGLIFVMILIVLYSFYFQEYKVPSIIILVCFFILFLIGAPIFICALIDSYKTVKNEDRFIKFIRKNYLFSAYITSDEINERYLKEFGKNLRIGELKRINFFLALGIPLGHPTYKERDRYLGIKKRLFHPLIYLSKNKKKGEVIYGCIN